MQTREYTPPTTTELEPGDELFALVVICLLGCAIIAVASQLIHLIVRVLL